MSIIYLINIYYNILVVEFKKKKKSRTLQYKREKKYKKYFQKKLDEIGYKFKKL